MVFGWNLIGKRWTSQYDENAVLAELTRRFDEGAQVRKSPVAAAREEEVYPSEDHGVNMGAGHQECAAGIIDGDDTSR